MLNLLQIVLILFLTSVAAKLNENIVKVKKPFPHYLRQTTDENIFLSPTTSADIDSLNSNKGTYPDLLKVGNVILVYKKAISLSSNISKLYEKAMHIRLTNFLRKNSIVLFTYQFRFRNNYQLIKLLKPHINDMKCS